MSLTTPRTLAAIGAGLAALALAGGFARGVWFGTVHAYDAAEAGVTAVIAAPRDPQTALAALGMHRHWGEYRPPAAAERAPAPAAEPGVAGNAIARDFVLVGIRGHGPRRQALLLPRGEAVAAGDAMIRLRAGDTLVDGVRVEAVANASVRLRTGDTTLTLHLYGNPP